MNLDSNLSYIFILKPSVNSWFSDPIQALDFIIDSMLRALSVVIALVVVFAFGFVIYAAFGMG